MRVASSLIFAIIRRLPFPLLPLLSPLALGLLVRLEVLALLCCELDACVVRQQLAEALSAGCRVGLFAKPPEP